MNFMQKCKRNGGFTLVELIVVIAILAILAGVAVPAYTGYIKKAEEAADQQLLGTVNTAFAAACLENGIDASSIDDLSVSFNITTKTVSKYAEEFARYFAGNESAEFKAIKNNLIFLGGVFVDPANVDEIPVTLNGNKFMISSEKLQAFNSSSLAQLGSEALLNQVDLVASYGSAMMGPGGALSGIDYASVINGIYGDNTAYDARLTETAQKIAQEMLAENPALADDPDFEQTVFDKAKYTLNANSAVLSAAQNASKMDKSTVTTLLGSEGAMTTILNNLDNAATAEQGLAEAALAYGMVIAYAQNSGNTTLLSSLQGSAGLASMDIVKEQVNSKEFRDYVNSDVGKSDLDGYMSALDIINTSASKENPDAVTDVLVNGFGTEGLMGVLGGLTGN